MWRNANIKAIRNTLFYLILLLGGCVPMAEISIQVMEPASITLPSNVQQIAFMNRSPVPQLFHSDKMEWSEEEYYILDTIMNTRIFQGIRESLTASPLFDLDTMILMRLKRYDTIGTMEALSPLQMQNIKEIQPADALLSLEYYNIQDSVHVTIRSDDLNYFYEAYMGIYTTTLWRVYDLNNDTLVDEYTLHDTANWYSYEDNAGQAIDKLPQAIDAIREAAIKLGTIYGDRISPGWQQVPRYYHNSGGKEMRMAAKKTVSDDWLGAAEIYKTLAYGEKQKTAAKACFNMALVCEMEDLMIPALDWATKSYMLDKKSLTQDYIELLQRRIQNREKLENQVPSGWGE